jgi:hypothetical protein
MIAGWGPAEADGYLLRSCFRWYPGDNNAVFCRITQLGFLRLLTNRHVMQEDVLSPDRTWQAYQVLRTDRRIGYVGEPAELREPIGLIESRSGAVVGVCERG